MELVGFCRDNTVLGNMAKSKVAFIVWLYGKCGGMICMYDRH